MNQEKGEGRMKNLQDYLWNELLNGTVDVMELKEVIAHELLHTVPRCLSHGKPWRRYAKVLNDIYGYSLLEEKDDDAIFHKEMPVIHKVACPVCGAFYNCRMRKYDWMHNLRKVLYVPSLGVIMKQFFRLFFGRTGILKSYFLKYFIFRM